MINFDKGINKKILHLICSSHPTVETGLRAHAAETGLDGVSLLDSMVEHGLLSHKSRARLLAGIFEMEFVDLELLRTDLRDWDIPVEMMYRSAIVPVEQDDDSITIAVSDPGEVLFFEDLEGMVKKKITYKVAAKTEIMDCLKRSQGASQLLENIGRDFVTADFAERDDDNLLNLEDLARDESPVIRLVNTIVINALQQRASDIHIETTDSGVNIKYRIDGVLYHAMQDIDHGFHEPLISRIKVMSELDISERMIPQDGRFKLKIDNKKVDFRVSVLPGIFGEDIVIRILDKEFLSEGFKNLSLDTLGFNKGDLKRFKKAIREPYGMVLVTGPTGSGKTTTLYAAVCEINSVAEKIITIEDPVEYNVAGIVQVPVNEKKGLTFSKGLRSILRHDPDKIMVGEIRDLETASIAVQSALTGHLVFTTVHANNAFDVIGRFLNLGIDPYNFVASLNCILAQRLVRKICGSCREQVKITAATLEEFNIAAAPDTIFYQGAGCVECNGTGFSGREAITEFMAISDNIRGMVLDKRPLSEIKKCAIAEGLLTLRDSAKKKLLKGVTTLDEINRVTFIE